MMLFDTDILIWTQRGNGKAARLLESERERFISAQTYMELLQGAGNKRQHKVIKDFLGDFGFLILPLTENISHRALVYIEEYALRTGLRAGDALVAATATEHNLVLSTSNRKHYKAIKGLNLKLFSP